MHKVLTHHTEAHSLSISSVYRNLEQTPRLPSTLSELSKLGHNILILREQYLQEEWGPIPLLKQEIKGVKVFRGQVSWRYTQGEAAVRFEVVSFQLTCVPQAFYLRVILNGGGRWERENNQPASHWNEYQDSQPYRMVRNDLYLRQCVSYSQNKP